MPVAASPSIMTLRRRCPRRLPRRRCLAARCRRLEHLQIAAPHFHARGRRRWRRAGGASAADDSRAPRTADDARRDNYPVGRGSPASADWSASCGRCDRVVVVGHDGVLSAMFRMRVMTWVPGQQRGQPQHRIEPPEAAGDAGGENDGVARKPSPPASSIAYGGSRRGSRIALLVAGLSGEIADHLAAEARARDRGNGATAQVRIVRLLGAAMMLEVVVTIGDQFRPDRIGAQILAEELVEASACISTPCEASCIGSRGRAAVRR